MLSVNVKFLPGDVVRAADYDGDLHIVSVELHGDADGWEEVYMLEEGAKFMRHFCTELTLVRRADDNKSYEVSK